MNKYQLSLCGYEKKNQHSKRGRVGGDTHNDCCGNVAFRGTGCRETTVAVGGEIVAGRRMDSNCAGCSFRWMAILFFSQLFLGIFVDSMFLMSGKLHFPIPGLIPAGVFYRGEVSFMPFLFLVTILLSGGAWCSQLCYFGAWDSLAAGKNGKREALSSKMRTRMRWTVLFVFIGVASALRGFGIPVIYSTGIAAFAGIVGIMIIGFMSKRRHVAMHCSSYCPAGTLVMYLKQVSPWRLRLNDRCRHCMACTRVCRYGALSKVDVLKGRPAINCTLCGDCLAGCGHDALEYHLGGISPVLAERLWLGTTLVLFTCFLSIARV